MGSPISGLDAPAPADNLNTDVLLMPGNLGALL